MDHHSNPETQMEILGVTVHRFPEDHTFWLQLRNRPKYWWSIIYYPDRLQSWACHCYYGWTWNYGEQRSKSCRIIHIGPFELSRDEK